ncbi:MAG TPA: 30S ribosomal protein S5 alanine N-acetyltransferase [Vibrio sp.]|nr:30S ribosomal protein S5 alanine N-acetyltransferase [Vibrio sp.]
MTQVSTPQAVYEVEGDIVLRMAEPTDAYMIQQYFITNREYLKEWEPKREDEFFSLSGWTQRLIKLNELHKHALGYYLLVIDKPSGEMLGTISFSNLTRFPFYACNVGYSLSQSAQGRGIMTCALKLAVNYMFTIQNMHRIMASYMPHNERSGAVLSRVGFKREGYAKDYLLINDEWRDHVLTALTNPGWKPDR